MYKTMGCKINGRKIMLMGAVIRALTLLVAKSTV